MSLHEAGPRVAAVLESAQFSPCWSGSSSVQLIEIEFIGGHHTVVTAELLEEEAPIACENLWEAIAEPLRARLHHGRHCASAATPSPRAGTLIGWPRSPTGWFEAKSTVDCIRTTALHRSHFLSGTIAPR